MILVALNGKEKRLFGYKNYEEMSVWVIQVLIEQVSCIFLTAFPHFVYTYSQIKSFLWDEACDSGEMEDWGRGSTHIEEENSDWERVSQEL